MRVADDGTPPVVSARGSMRSTLPAIYRETDFGLRFLGALELLLDPIVGILDVLPSYLDPDVAPRDALEMLAGFGGLALDESWSDERCRDAVRLIGELGRWRGTRRGLELALSIAFPELPLRIEGGGGVTWAADPAGGDQDLASVELTVYCDVPLPSHDQALLARIIERVKPIHVPYRLRVRASKKAATGETQASKAAAKRATSAGEPRAEPVDDDETPAVEPEAQSRTTSRMRSRSEDLPELQAREPGRQRLLPELSGVSPLGAHESHPGGASRRGRGGAVGRRRGATVGRAAGGGDGAERWSP